MPSLAVLMNLLKSLRRIAAAEFNDLQRTAVGVVNLSVGDFSPAPRSAKNIFRNPAFGLLRILTQQPEIDRGDVKIVRYLQWMGETAAGACITPRGFV
jgi:hypothetical protein